MWHRGAAPAARAAWKGALSGSAPIRRAPRVALVNWATVPHRALSSYISSSAARSALVRSLALSTTTATLFYTPPSRCKGQGDDDNVFPGVEEWAPTATTVGFGSASGFACGYIVKKLGKAAMGIGGVLFMTFQAANYYGCVHHPARPPTPPCIRAHACTRC